MMSHHNDSDSDDFFDARQDLGSPQHTPSSLLVVEDDDSQTTECIENLDAPSNIEGTLSLDHLLTPENESISTANSVEKLKQDQLLPEETVKNDNLLETVTAPDSASKETEVFSNQVLSDDVDFCPSSVNELENKIEREDLKVDSLNTDLTITKHIKPDEKFTKITENNDVTTEDVEIANPADANQLQKPDLVASIKERPFDLPGVQSFSLQTEVAVEPVPRVHHPSPARPKRPPPPRPKAPPKRPPLPKGSSHPILKPYLSSADDGLLTPNSTVDNITREFAAALGDVATKPEEPTPRVEQNITENKPTCPSSLAATGQQKLLQPLAESPQSSQSKETPNRRRSLGRQLSGATNSNSQLDEDVKWSEVTKETVLRIDSSPGLEILSTVIVRNLDTGQTMPLSVAAEQVSQCLNPLALQIMSRTKEFNCATVNPEEKVLPVHNKPLTPEFPKVPSIDEDTISVDSDDITIGGEAVGGKSFGENSRKIRMKSKRFKQFIGKGARRVKEAAGTQVGKAVHKVKHSKTDNSHSEALNVSSDEEITDSMASSFVKTKASSSNKDSHLLTARLKLVQDIAVHVGAVWSMKFSHCGRLLATAGQNNVIWVWVLKDYYAYFNDLRNKYDSKERGMVFATPPRSSMEPLRDEDEQRSSKVGSDAGGTLYSGSDEPDDEEDAPFRSLPFSSYVGHTADVLDLAWSKNYFTLSSSMDKTVRLWHVSQKECLCCFQHIDFVTAIAFHPRDDRYFLSGSLDSKLRLWNIPEKKVALWNEVPPDSHAGSSSTGGGALITTVNFCENGKFAVCGTYDGRCLFYDTEHLKYHTQIHVRSSRRRNNKGHKITGIEPLASEHKILVTSNDSRVRLYDLRDLSLTCKFKGLTNLSSQIKASFSHDNKYIICGSEDKAVYIWKTNPPQDVTKLSSLRRDRNDSWESIRAHNAVVTCAIFAPHPHLMVRVNERSESGSRSSLRSSSKKSAASSNLYIITADFNGVIKIFSTS